MDEVQFSSLKLLNCLEEEFNSSHKLDIMNVDEFMLRKMALGSEIKMCAVLCKNAVSWQSYDSA